MCGRYTITKEQEELEKAFERQIAIDNYEYAPVYNAAPSYYLPVIAQDNPEAIRLFKWGIIPSYSKTEKVEFSNINVKKETIDTSKLYAPLFKRKRCLVLGDGFIEWKKLDAKNKQPYRLLLNSEEAFAMAGLFDRWVNKETGEIINSFVIATTTPNETTGFVHDRMPVILNKEAANLWLDPATDISFLKEEVMVSYPDSEMKLYPVAKEIGKAGNNVSSLLEKIDNNPVGLF